MKILQRDLVESSSLEWVLYYERLYNKWWVVRDLVVRRTDPSERDTPLNTIFLKSNSKPVTSTTVTCFSHYEEHFTSGEYG